MSSDTTRRTVLRAAGVASFAATIAGCTQSLPGQSEGSDPCAAVRSYVDAVGAGDPDAAIEYIPYEYTAEYDREYALNLAESDHETVSTAEIDCETGDELDEGEIDELGANLDDHEITAAQEITMTITGENGDQEREVNRTVVEIDGDGWYLWVR